MLAISVVSFVRGSKSAGVLFLFATVLFVCAALMRPSDRGGAASSAQHRPSAALPTTARRPSPTDEEDDDYEEDPEYRRFVETMWRRPGVFLSGVTLTRLGPEATQFRAHSLVDGENGYPYINGWEGSRQLTLAADDRHKWAFNGSPVDSSAFLAIAQGYPVAAALGPQRRPASAAEALSPEFDHVATTERRYLIHYVNADGHSSWRVVSRVFRSDDGFTARCHFRWGQRRTFRFDRVREVIDGTTGEEIPLDQFVSGGPMRPAQNRSMK